MPRCYGVLFRAFGPAADWRRPCDRRPEEVNATLAAPVPLVDEPSTLAAEAVVWAADLGISSRFHGLISALALACGWSHKYGELMADYGCPRHVIDPRDESAWRPRLDGLLRDADDDSFRAGLQAAASQQRARSETMWQAVIATMRDVH